MTINRWQLYKVRQGGWKYRELSCNLARSRGHWELVLPISQLGSSLYWLHSEGMSPEPHSKCGRMATRPSSYQSDHSEELECSFLPGSFIKRPRNNSDWTPLDHVPITERITVAEEWSTPIGQAGHVYILRARDGVGPTWAMWKGRWGVAFPKVSGGRVFSGLENMTDLILPWDTNLNHNRNMGWNGSQGELGFLSWPCH